MLKTHRVTRNRNSYVVGCSATNPQPALTHPLPGGVSLCFVMQCSRWQTAAEQTRVNGELAKGVQTAKDNMKTTTDVRARVCVCVRERERENVCARAYACVVHYAYA